MQGHQDHISATSADYMAYLMIPRPTFSPRSSACTKRAVDEDAPGVPDSPGCARRLRPYPPSHRRRQ
jgi:hypothetical protein